MKNEWACPCDMPVWISRPYAAMEMIWEKPPALFDHRVTMESLYRQPRHHAAEWTRSLHLLRPKDSRSKANSPEEIGKFWDKHSFTEFDDPSAPDVEFQVSATIPIEPDLLSDIEELAQIR
ncbi:MAG: hypothetical protein AB1649_34530, partial [Chloroflexota bacterium]